MGGVIAMSKFRAMLNRFSEKRNLIFQNEFEADCDDINFVYGMVRDFLEKFNYHEVVFEEASQRDELFAYSHEGRLVGWIVLEKMTEGHVIVLDDGRFAVVKDTGLVTFTQDLTFATLFDKNDAAKLSDIIMKYAPQRIARVKTYNSWRPIK
jgi:hypothetical protein